MKKKAKKTGKKTKDTGDEKDTAADTPATGTPEPTADAVAPPPPPPPAEEEEAVDSAGSPTLSAPPSSLAQASKARSTSFRQGSISLGSGAGGAGGLGPLSPGLGGEGGETAMDIYRKQQAKIEELEKEKGRWEKEAKELERKLGRVEGELEDLREAEGGKNDDGEVEKLKNEIEGLKRQNQQLMAQRKGHGGGGGSISVASPPPAAELERARETIQTMELEMGRLRAQVERLSAGGGENEQVAALEEKLGRAERAAGLAQREVGDLKVALERVSEKVVKEGSARSSAETKASQLEKEAKGVREEKEGLVKKVEGLEKKVVTLTTLHKEHDARMQGLKREKEKLEKELGEVQGQLEKVEAENLKLRKKDAQEGGGDDEGVDELIDEERARLERRIRELEGENADLRRGIWHEKRKEMQVGPEGEMYENVDLGGGGPGPGQGHGQGGGFGQLISSGLSALTGGGHQHHGHHHGHGHQDDGFLDDDDDELEFDEEAFRRAQEEEGRKRLERIKEIKRGLKNWEGWRLDLVENRRGGGEGVGVGEIFEV